MTASSYTTYYHRQKQLEECDSQLSLPVKGLFYLLFLLFPHLSKTPLEGGGHRY